MAGQGYQVGKGFSIPPMVNNSNTTTTINATTGGSLPAGTYYVRSTYSTANGETNANTTEQTITISGSNNAFTVQVGSQYAPAGATAFNVYVGTASGQESFQASTNVIGNSVLITSINTNSRPLPQWNTTSFQDINPSALGLSAGSEFIVHNLYYNNPVAFGIWDGTNLVMFDGDVSNGARMGLSIHCNASQWLRVFNQNNTSTVQVAIDGMQTQ